MSRKLKLLFLPIDSVGHVNASIGVAQVLMKRGHSAYFGINEQWKGRLTKYGIYEVLLNQEDIPSDGDPALRYANQLIEMGVLKSCSSLETITNLFTKFMPYMGKAIKAMDPKVEQLLKTLCPDVVFIDNLIHVPSVEVSGIPWVFLSSMQPLFNFDCEATPPYGSGLPTDASIAVFQEFRRKLRESSLKEWEEWNDYVVSLGLNPLDKNKWFRDSKWLNIYDYPIELDYTDIRPLPPKWFRFDNLKRTEKQSGFEIPERLSGRPGKLIYLSLGSMGGGDLELMKRLIAILSKSKHRFIISKGPLHDRYELPDNMWGKQFVNQIRVLSAVDLVITHGGNNTVTETLFFGKPMIVMPLFSDQFDNAQRIQEKGFGIRLSPYDCSEEELLTAIESLLNDKELNEKLKNISKRIQNDNSIEKIPQLIENLVI